MKDNTAYLHHILESITAIEQYRPNSFQAFQRDKQAQDAIMRRLEIIGEAVKQLPVRYTKQYPDIAWQDIAGMRDRLIHHYFGVDLEVVWAVALKDLKSLQLAAHALLSGEEANRSG